jgi:hypothetical protein
MRPNSLGGAMSLSDLASLGSFVSGVAVLFSLIYLALQVRQAKHHQRSLMVQGQTARVIELYAEVIGNGDFARILDKGRDGATDLTSTELLRLSFWYRAIAASREESFLQHKAGLMDDASFESVKAATRLAFSGRGARAHWMINRATFSSDYAAWVDELLSSIPEAPPVDMVKRWSEVVASLEKLDSAHA